MCKRKSEGAALKVASRPTSSSSSSSGKWPEFSSSSSSVSSVSYTSKMPKEGICVFSSEAEEKDDVKVQETKAMALVGCPRCFMYVMLSEVDPKCPKCKSTVFLEFFKDENFKPDN